MPAHQLIATDTGQDHPGTEFHGGGEDRVKTFTVRLGRRVEEFTGGAVPPGERWDSAVRSV